MEVAHLTDALTNSFFSDILNNSFSYLGYICERRHLEKTSGCCQTTSSSILGPYKCDTCTSKTHCCASFEHCISCCLKPDHVLSFVFFLI